MAAAVLLLLSTVGLLIKSSFAVFPPYFPVLNQNVHRNDLLVQYFHLGLDYKEILALLVLLHGFQLSLRQLKRVLGQRTLGRRRNPSDLMDVVSAIEHELTGSGSSLGYRSMSQRLASEHGLNVHKETVKVSDYSTCGKKFTAHCLKKKLQHMSEKNYSPRLKKQIIAYV